MKPRPLKIAAAVLAALGVAGVTVGIALLRSGFLDRAIRPLSWTTWGYIVLGAVLYGLAAVALVLLVAALAALVRRLFLARSAA